MGDAQHSETDPAATVLWRPVTDTLRGLDGDTVDRDSVIEVVAVTDISSALADSLRTAGINTDDSDAVLVHMNATDWSYDMVIDERRNA